MKVLITGIGDAFSGRHFGTSAVIEAPGGYVLIDCPDSIHRVLENAKRRSGWPLDALAIDDVIVTHLHGDHCNGLESFGFLRRLRRLADGHGVIPRLHVAPLVAERLWSRLAPAMDAPFGTDRPSTLDDYFELHVLPDPGERGSARGEVAGLGVRCRSTLHSIPAIGLLIDDGDATLAWSGDTPFDRDHIDWLAAGDVIVHESNAGSAHTPIEALNALPRSIRDRMRLIHLPDDFDLTRTPITPLREGEVLCCAPAVVDR